MIRLALSIYRQSEKMRFLFIGGINTVFGLSTWPALLIIVPFFREHYLLGLAICLVVNTTFSFLTMRAFVFKVKNNIFQDFSKFCSFYFGTYILNIITLPILVEILHFDPLYAQTGFGVFVIATSYLWHSRISFRRARP